MRVLITTNHLRNLAGSEIVAIELIEHFLGRGWFVDVYTHDLGEPVLSVIQSIPEWGRLQINVAAMDVAYEDDYDLVWIQHSVLPPGLLRRLERDGLAAPMVWHHLSSFMDIEMPRHAGIEGQLAAISTGMSSTVVDRLVEFGLDPARLVVFDNPAPDAFADFEREPVGPLRRVLVVSNHAPHEVREAATVLERGGVEVVFLGAADRPVRVVPELLADIDAVITIGKTVQYALSMGIPVYVYDHFGGPGWVDESNFAPVAYDNFSGRADRRQVEAAQLAHEFLTGFEAARDFAIDRRAAHAEHWRLSRRIDDVLADPRVAAAPRVRLSREDARQLSSLIALHRDLYRLVVKLQDDVARLEASIAPAIDEAVDNT